MGDEARTLILQIAGCGREHRSMPDLAGIEPFRHYFTTEGLLDRSSLDSRDGSCTRREVLLRYLLLAAVLDQGPDIQGVRDLLSRVTTCLYREETRFLHRPLAFFENLGIAADRISSVHEAVKECRARDWAAANQSRANRYSLFMDNAQQLLCYAVFRWGAPLAVPMILEMDLLQHGSADGQSTALLDYLERCPSAEIMSRELKDNRRYGLGKAVGDKACHLFAKWMVSSYALTRKSGPGWDGLSYELPYDSNAGRVLWRTGYLLRWATEEDYVKYGVVQRRAGKGGTNYLRITNLRGKTVTRYVPDDVRQAYGAVVTEHLRTRRRFRKICVHELQHAYLYQLDAEHPLSVADLDDGLVYIGTSFCFNHSEPECDHCPIEGACVGRQSQQILIDDYRT